MKEKLDVAEFVKDGPHNAAKTITQNAEKKDGHKMFNARERLLRSAKILERMVVQDAYRDIAFG